MDAMDVATTGFLQGLGTGFVFVPITTTAFTTLNPALRTDGTGVYTLIRSLGASAGISIMQAIYVKNVQVVHSRLVERLTPDNPLIGSLQAPFSLATARGVSALNGEVTRQASMVAYDDVYHLMFLITVVLAPIVLMLRPPKAKRLAPSMAPDEDVLVAE
jgi:DHA2 family multidrug resistance protein